MKILDWLFNKPFSLVATHISIKDAVVGQPVKLQAVVRRRWHAHHKPVNLHIELHDECGNVVAKKQARDLTPGKGELVMIEWDYVVPAGQYSLKMKIGVFNKDYTETLSWWNPCGLKISIG